MTFEEEPKKEAPTFVSIKTDYEETKSRVGNASLVIRIAALSFRNIQNCYWAEQISCRMY